MQSPVGICGHLNETTMALEGSRGFTAQASEGGSHQDHAGSRLLLAGFRGKEHGASTCSASPASKAAPVGSLQP